MCTFCGNLPLSIVEDMILLVGHLVFADIADAGAVTLTLGSSTINCTNVSFAAATLTVSDNTATMNVTCTADITADSRRCGLGYWW